MKKPKRPELKVPPVLEDLFYDLRDRRLLPLIGVIAVATVAVPFLLSNSTKPPPSSAALGAALAQQAGAGTARFTVVAENPGLRDYRKRLSDLRAKDPFKQQYTGPVLKGAHLNSQTSSVTTSTTTTTDSGGASSTSPTSTTVTSPTSTSPANGGHGTQPHLTYFTFAIDVKITRSAGEGADATTSEPTTRQRVMPTTPLPGEKAPVVVYMGADSNAKKALLLVSTDVKSVFGDAKCLSGADACQLLEVEPGFPETFVYGPNDVRYKINVLKIEPVVSGHP